MNLESLRARLGELQTANDDFLALLASEDREPTDAETAEVDARLAEIEKVEANVARFERMQAGAKPNPRQVRDAVPSAAGRSTVPASPRTDPRTAGFNGLGQFAHAVRAATRGDTGANERLRAAATGNNEGVGSEGGFLVPPEFRDRIWTKVMGDQSLMSRCNVEPIGGNSLVVPKDEATPWGSAGFQVYWEGEAATATASKVALESQTARLNKLFGLVRVTDELMEDAPSLGVYLNSRAPIRIAQAVNTAIVTGNGVGKPLGLLNADCKIAIAKETSQPAATVFHNNIVKMKARLYAECFPNAVWLINQDVMPQLDLMSFADVGKKPSTATGTQVPIYMPAGTIAGSPYGTLYGRPVIPVQACKTLGTEGDIILTDLSQYQVVTKSGGIRTDVSMHLYFDSGEQAFRFTFRVYGAPMWNSAISPENGSNTLSCIVTTAVRA